MFNVKVSHLVFVLGFVIPGKRVYPGLLIQVIEILHTYSITYSVPLHPVLYIRSLSSECGVKGSANGRLTIAYVAKAAFGIYHVYKEDVKSSNSGSDLQQYFQFWCLP